MRVLVAAGAAVLTLLVPANASAKAHAQPVRGGWVGALPCAFTSLTPSSSDPTQDAFSCVSGTVWDGSWTGQTMYTAQGTINLLTGDARGTLDETFYGVSTLDQTTGTLHFLERFFVQGATDTIHIDLKLTGGTGDWVGSRGTATFDGVQASGVAGHGGYSGTWIRP
jgi:hypothetical protein